MALDHYWPWTILSRTLVCSYLGYLLSALLRWDRCRSNKCYRCGSTDHPFSNARPQSVNVFAISELTEVSIALAVVKLSILPICPSAVITKKRHNSRHKQTQLFKDLSSSLISTISVLHHLLFGLLFGVIFLQ